MIQMLTYEDLEVIANEMKVLNGEVAQLRQDFNQLVEELKVQTGAATPPKGK